MRLSRGAARASAISRACLEYQDSVMSAEAGLDWGMRRF